MYQDKEGRALKPGPVRSSLRCGPVLPVTVSAKAYGLKEEKAFLKSSKIMNRRSRSPSVQE